MVIAIASSDWHLHNFSDFNTPKGHRLKMGLEAGGLILNRAKELGVPHIFGGDLFHNPGEVPNNVITETIQLFQNSGVETYGIDGNHDQMEANTTDHRSPCYETGIPNFKLLHWDDGPTKIAPGVVIYGIPYLKYDEDLAEVIHAYDRQLHALNILLIHANLPGAKNQIGFGIESGLPVDLNKLFKKWDLVLCGHIHKPQRLSDNHIIMGSHIHQTRGDEGCKMGYWEIHLKNGKLKAKFVSLNHLFPEFVTEKPGEYFGDLNKEHKDYVTVVAEPVAESEDMVSEGFKDTSNRKQLVKAYFKATGIKDKEKRNLVTELINKA